MYSILFAIRYSHTTVRCHGRNHGTVWAHGLRGDELLCTRYRQHGWSIVFSLAAVCPAHVSTYVFRGSGTLWERRAAKEVVGASAEWGYTFGIRDDGKIWCVLDYGLETLANSAHMQVASSDATNIRTSIRQEGNEIVINGHKWFAHLFVCDGSVVDVSRVLLL